MITIDDLGKIELKIGTILSAEAVPDADKLIRFMIDLGVKETPVVISEEGVVSESDIPQEKVPEKDIRQILSGVRMYYPDPSVLVGRQVPVVANLAPRTIRGFESHGMIMYAIGDGESFCTLEPTKQVLPGTLIR